MPASRSGRKSSWPPRSRRARSSTGCTRSASAGVAPMRPGCGSRRDDREAGVRFRGDPSSLRGSIAPVVTPFTDAGELDLTGLRRLISWQLDSGSHGISLGGSTGEPSAQTALERITAMTEAAAVIADRVPFLPGTGSARLDETLRLPPAGADLG